MKIERCCVFCGTPKSIEVDDDGFDCWRRGMRIQDALPKLSADDREMLISGICSECFDKTFAE